MLTRTFRKTLITLTVSAALLQSTAALAERRVRPEKPAFDGVFPVVQGGGSLTISGNGYWHSERLGPGDHASITAYVDDGGMLPDGNYRFEFRSVEATRLSDNSGSSQSLATLDQRQSRKREQLVSGSFNVTGGAIVFK